MTDTTLIELSRSAPRANPLAALARRLVFARLATLLNGLLRACEKRPVPSSKLEQIVNDAETFVMIRPSANAPPARWAS